MKVVFQLIPIGRSRGGGKLEIKKPTDKSLNVKEIEKNMDYPKGASCDMTVHPPTDIDGGGAGRDGPDPGNDGGGHSDGQGSNDVGGGRRTERVKNKLRRITGSGTTGNSRKVKWLDSVKAKLKVAMADAYLEWNPPEFDLRSNLDDRRYDQRFIRLFELDDDEYAKSIDLLRQCKFKIITCTDDWVEKSEFTCNEKISVKIQINNPTGAHVVMEANYGKGFGRCGLQLKFVDILPEYCRGDRSGYYIPIGPGETYTLWRRFASGDQNSMLHKYSTPQVPGVYTLQVVYHDLIFDKYTQQITINSK